MARKGKNQPILFLALTQEVECFPVDREARNCTPETLRYCQDTLRAWVAWLQDEGVATLPALTANHLRAYPCTLPTTATMRAASRTATTRCAPSCAGPSAPPGRDNPIHKVTPPKRPQEIRKPIELDAFARLLEACSRTDNGERDRALLLVLLDTGLRRQEVTDLTVGDVDGSQFPTEDSCPSDPRPGKRGRFRS